MTGRLSEMTPAATLTGAELVELTQSANTRRTTVGAIATLSSAGIPTVINAITGYGATGDGVTNDRTAIQNALNAASAAGGGIVYLPSGTFNVGTAGVGGVQLSVPSEVILRGAGSKATIIKSVSAINGHQVLQFATSANQARIESLGVDAVTGTTSSAGVSGHTVTDCTVVDCDIAPKFGWGVFIGTNSLHFKVVRCVIGSNGSHGVEINQSSYCSVESCHITNPGLSGGNNIEIYDNTSFRCVGNRLIDNQLHGPGTAAPASAILTAGDIGTVISGNHIINANLYGIFINNSAIDSSRLAKEIIISNNVLKGCNTTGGAAGILVGGSARGNTISDNTVESTALAGPGIQVDGIGNTLSGNTAILNGGPGIHINSTAHRSTVIGNVCIDNSGTGVGARSGMRVEADYCKIIGNVASDTRGGSARQYHGINIGVSTGNVCVGNGGTGNLNVVFGDDGGGTTTKLGNESGTTYLPGLLIGTDVQAWDTDLDAVANNGGAEAPMGSGLYYPAPQRGTTSTIAPTLNLMYLVRLPRPGGKGISNVSVEVVAGNTGGGVLRFGIYSDVGGVPTTLLVDLGLGVGAPDTPGVMHGANANHAAGSSPLWLAMVPQTSIASMTLRSVTAPGGWGSSAGLSAARGEAGYAQASVSGALPGTAAVSSKVVGNMPVLVVLTL